MDTKSMLNGFETTELPFVFPAHTYFLDKLPTRGYSGGNGYILVVQLPCHPYVHIMYIASARWSNFVWQDLVIGGRVRRGCHYYCIVHVLCKSNFVVIIVLYIIIQLHPQAVATQINMAHNKATVHVPVNAPKAKINIQL